jgi:WD40 repeat protein
VRAGLINYLYLETVGGNQHWKIATMRPGDQPFYNLASGILDKPEPFKPTLQEEYLKHNKSTIGQALQNLSRRLRDNPQGSYKELENILPANHNLLIVLDQFEELVHFSGRVKGESPYISNPQYWKEVEDFIVWILASSCIANSRIYIVITMRSEFLDDCANYDNLISAINDGFFQIPELKTDNLKEAIKYPAEVCGGKLEDKLVERLLEDVEKMGNDTRADHLPLLQYTLRRMWLDISEECEEKILTLEAYENIGGDLSTILSKNADETFESLNDDDKKIAEILFRRLSHKKRNGDYVRRPVELSVVATLSNEINANICNLVTKFTVDDGVDANNQNFLFVHHKNQNGNLQPDSIVDIRHESIIRQWEKLRKWADDEAELAKYYLEWETVAWRWREHDGERKNELLWRGLELENLEGKLWRDVYFSRLYPEKKQLQAWAECYSEEKYKRKDWFDIAWKFIEESKKVYEQEKEEYLQHQLELQDAKRERQIAEDLKKIAEDKRKIERRKRKVATYAAIISFILVIGFGALAYGLYNSWQVTKQAEQILAERFFDSEHKVAVVSARIDDFTQAQKSLDNTRAVDSKINSEAIHARDLLANLIKTVYIQPEFNYDGNSMLYSLAVSPDASIIAAVGENGNVDLFERQNGNLLGKLDGHTGDVYGVAFHPKNEWLVTASEKEVIIWDISSKSIINTWPVHSEIFSVAVDVSGKKIATAGNSNEITIWASDSTKLKTLTGHRNNINSLAFSPDGIWLASASDDKNINIWQVSNWELVASFRGHTDAVTQIAFSPDATLLASVSADRTVRIWNLNSKQAVSTMYGHKDRINTVRFVDNQTIISGGADMMLRLWDVNSGVTLNFLQGHTGFVNAIATVGQQIFTCSTDHTVKSWDVTPKYRHILDLEFSPTAVAISPNATQIAVGFETGELELLAMPSGDFIAKPDQTLHSRDIQRLAFSPNQKFLATASLDGKTHILKIQAEKLINVHIIEHKKAVNAVAFSPDSKILTTASYDGTINYFYLNQKSDNFKQLYESDINSIVWRGDRLLTSSDNQAKLWQAGNLDTPLFNTCPPAKDTTMWAALSPNAQDIALVGRYFAVQLCSTNAQKPIYELQGHTETVIKAEFSPDGQQLLTVSGDNSVKAWDLSQKSELFTLRLPVSGQNAIWDFDFNCSTQKCWLAVPLSTNNRLVIYDLGEIYR